MHNYHLLTETEGNSVFCGPEKHRRSRVHKTHCFPEVSVNKLVFYYISIVKETTNYRTNERKYMKYFIVKTLNLTVA